MSRGGETINKKMLPMETSPKNKEVILDSLSEGVITINKDFQITFFNLAAEKITGLKRAEVTGKSCQAVCKYAFCETECPIALVLKNDKNLFDFQSQMRGRDGRTLQVRLNVAVLKDEQENPVGGVMSFRPMEKPDRFSDEEEVHGFFGMIGKSKSMQELFDLISEISFSDATILIQGETGTGKEMVANAIHATSKRREYSFIKVNCSVLPPHLLASELFGHCKGAFTDARRDRIGRFEVAHQGTIFLDEVAEIPLEMQPQLLRILQDGTFERLGESETRQVDVRVIAATNRNIEQAIRQGKFREDLYYRLNVIPIHVPPLRERKEDLPYLVRHFIRKYAPIYKKNITDVDEDVFQIFFQHDWPGNIRELENVIEFTCIRTKKNTSLCVCGLPPYLREKYAASENCGKVFSLADLKADQLISLLERHNWNQTKVAELLGVNRTTIWRKIKRLGIK
ncbi:MAG: sigma 54-interacting transcriptional regulator [Calditrichia bacterium]